MKNLNMNLEPLQILRLLYQYYIFIKDQQPINKDQLPVRKDQLQVLILVMKTVRKAMGTVHRVKTLEEQYSIQISTFLTNDEHWTMTLETHKLCRRGLDHFVLLQQEVEISRTYAI